MARISSLVVEAAPCCTRCGSEHIVKTARTLAATSSFAVGLAEQVGSCIPKAARRQRAEGRGAARRGHRATEPAGDGAHLWRGAQHDLGLARKKAEALPPLSDTLLPAAAGDVLELEELWSFAGSKANARWVWIALCRQTRQIVAFFVGDRPAQSARALRERIPPDYRCRATRSDFWLAYAEAFPRPTHRLRGKSEGQTNHAERFFCTLRQRLGRFVRKTLSFSKCDQMHELALRLFIHQYNQ